MSYNALLKEGGGAATAANPGVELPCMKDAMIDCSEMIGLVVLILNVLQVNLGTLISSCLDRKGCNCTAFCAAILQGWTAWCVIGYIWAIIHGYKIYQANQSKK